MPHQILRTARTVARPLAVYAAGAAPGQACARFVIVCPPRTGSELLVELLDSHPHIRCEGEIFKELRRSPLHYMAGRAAIARRDGALAWGCKILDLQLLWNERCFGSLGEFLGRATERGYTIVHLSRRDLIAQAASVVHADMTRHHFRASETDRFAPFAVDVAGFIAGLHNLDRNGRQLEEGLAGLDPIRIVYEDDLVDPAQQQATAERVAAALGLDPAPASSTLRAVAPRRASERITNWDELAAALRFTRFASLLDGVAG